ncbi:MAG: hypothetical protein H9777_01930 [Candidatus Phocaeicola faecigallinarum]|uniref:Uncharacterized protein n=1 Tax=Candidatus Phocaeicola faecigallinarum TaxID=2838732 RepID=A0A948WWK8_9BACT|nr:hypothetical protein [Candidatus Phocaeicola faecigallinarum]
MNKLFVLMLCCFAVINHIDAQKIKFEIAKDSTFNAADDYAQTSEGFDVDISQKNVVNLGIQLAQDVAYANSNPSKITDALANKSYYRQRVDLTLTSALPERTNVYSIITFLNDNSGTSSAMVTISNLEVEHFFNNNFKIRLGRLANTVSESQFFGRVALEETSAHVFGRRLFINDALEFDGSFKKKGGPSFFIGLKPQFKPLNLKAVYAGIHQTFKNGLQLHGIFSVNRQFEIDMQKYFPGFTGTDEYFSYEFEIAYKRPNITTFLNVGGNLAFKGLIPHASGKFDFINQLSPVVANKGDSFKETFTPAGGFRIFPAKMTPSLKFIAQAGLEAEFQGALTDRFSALNLCAYCKVNLTRRMVLTYYCTPQFIWQDFNLGTTSYIGGMVNYLRLSVTVGRPARMFL